MDFKKGGNPRKGETGYKSYSVLLFSRKVYERWEIWISEKGGYLKMGGGMTRGSHYLIITVT